MNYLCHHSWKCPLPLRGVINVSPPPRSPLCTTHSAFGQEGGRDSQTLVEIREGGLWLSLGPVCVCVREAFWGGCYETAMPRLALMRTRYCIMFTDFILCKELSSLGSLKHIS